MRYELESEELPEDVYKRQVYINAAKSFRMPTFMQLYGSGSPNYEANPLLKPEEGWTYEIGYKKASDSSMFKAALYLSLIHI